MNSQHLRLKWHFEKLDKYGPWTVAHWSKVLFLDKSTFFAFHLEIEVWRKTGEAQNPSCLKSNENFSVHTCTDGEILR